MSGHPALRWILVMAAGSLAACNTMPSSSSGPASAPGTSPHVAASEPTPEPSAAPVVMADARDCPTTLPRRSGPPGEARDAFFGWGASFGNGKLWVGGLWPHGVIAVGPGFVDHDCRVRMKIGWWREVDGRLRITGRRLDGPAPPLRSDVPAGYGPTGFQSSGVIFPTEGCWEITGSVHRTALTFVTFVIKRRTSSSG